MLGFQLKLSNEDERDESAELLPLFKDRVLSSMHADFQEYIQWLDFDHRHAAPVSILSVSGGKSDL